MPNENRPRSILIFEYVPDTGKLGGRRRCVLERAVEHLDMLAWVRRLEDEWRPGRYRIEFRDHRNVLVRGGVRAVTVRPPRY